MSRFAHVFVQRPRGEGTFQNLTLQAYCCEILRSKRFAARTADRIWRPGQHVDRIPHDPGPIAYAALDSDSRATGYYAPRSVKNAD